MTFSLPSPSSLLKFPNIKLNCAFNCCHSDPDETDGGLDQARVKEKEGVDSNSLTPGSSEGHTMSRHIRLTRSMTVTQQDDDTFSDEEDAK